MTMTGVKHKFHAKPQTVGNIRFASKLEARYYNHLLLRQRTGEIVFFLTQVPIRLPGGTIYRVDFLEFHADGSAHFVDTKGVQTPEFKIKKREIEAQYPFTIEIVTTLGGM